MEHRPLGAQISHMLKARDVDVIFGIPGVHNQELYRGIEEAGLTHILARHEQGAGFMADGYARATGRPGVAYVITGPGLCNIMTPMGQAYSDRVPLLVISSCLNKGDLGMGRGRLHEMRDQEIAAGTVCDWSLTAQDAASAYQLIDRALTEFAAGRTRPKHIQVPIEVLEGVTPPAPPKRVTQVVLDSGDVSVVEELLAKAERPIFVFGAGAIAAQEAVKTLLASTKAASFVTFSANGLVANDTPLYFGPSLARPSSEEVINQADLVIAIGSALSEVDLWRDQLGKPGTLIRVDHDPAALADHQNAQLQIKADATAFLKALAARSPMTQSIWTEAEVTKTRTTWRAEVNSERPGLLSVIDAIAAALPADTAVYSDMTQIAYAALEMWPREAPGLWHHPHGFGTLGYALPAAIGGAIARQGKPTLAIAGDYGFQYTLQELMVAVELELTLPIILWDNTKLGEIADSMTAAQIAPNAVTMKNPDFGAFARSFGAAAAAPQSLTEIAGTLDAAFNHKGPTVIHLTPAITA